MRNNDDIIRVLNEERTKQNLSISELSRRVGMAKSALSRYFNKTREFPLNKAEDFASALGITSEYLLGFEEASTTTLTLVSETTAKLDESRQKIVLSTAKRQLEEQLHEQETVNKKVVPLVGKSAANPAVLEYGDTDIEEHSFTHVPNEADCAINIQGDSMEPLIKNGSIVFYKKQCDVENGEIAIVEIDGDGITCKKVIKDHENQLIILRSINEKYDDRILLTEEIRIIGKVIL
ncbi:TPA: XRE family transcriptional regulator [Enterococcus faecalis]